VNGGRRFRRNQTQQSQEQRQASQCAAVSQATEPRGCGCFVILSAQPLNASSAVKTMQLDQLVPRGLAAHQFDAVATAIQPVRQQPKQRFIGGGIHRGAVTLMRSSAPSGSPISLARRAAAALPQQDSVDLDAQIIRDGHGNRRTG